MDAMKDMKLPKPDPDDCCPKPVCCDEDKERYPELSLYGEACSAFLQKVQVEDLKIGSELVVPMKLRVTSLGRENACFDIVAAGQPKVTGQADKEEQELDAKEY